MENVLDKEQIAELNQIDAWQSCVRCDCGELIFFKMPCLCPKCSEPKLFWRTVNAIVPFSQMNLGHLSNVIKILGERAEKHPTGVARQEIEIAMDLIYAEINSRDLELKQINSIHNALKRSLV